MDSDRRQQDQAEDREQEFSELRRRGVPLGNQEVAVDRQPVFFPQLLLRVSQEEHRQTAAEVQQDRDPADEHHRRRQVMASCHFPVFARLLPAIRCGFVLFFPKLLGHGTPYLFSQTRWMVSIMSFVLTHTTSTMAPRETESTASMIKTFDAEAHGDHVQLRHRTADET